MATVFVSIGSNIERERSVRFGVKALDEQFEALVLSPVYETEAVGFAGDDFLNLVASFETRESPQQVMERLHQIEDACGRDRSGPKFSSRTLDIDLLLYGDLDLHDQGMNVPRDEITRYAFVLKPLVDLAPDRLHPQLGQSYAALWQAMGAGGHGMRQINFTF